MQLNISKYIDKYRPQINALLLRLKPIKDYWLRLSGRDQQVLMIVGALIAMMLIGLLISSAISFNNSLKADYAMLSAQRMDSQLIAKQYKDLSQITPNDFSSVNSDRIKGDAQQILDSKDSEIIFADNTLSVGATNVKFESLMLFLDQLRKSYGLFPAKLKITRLGSSGYVAFNATFNNVEQQ